MKLLTPILALVLAAPMLAQAPAPTANLDFVVVKDANGKPVRNATIVLRLFKKNGEPEKGSYELKTSSEGKTEFPSVPYGKLRVQVIARGFQTFGEDFEIDEPQETISIRLKPPQDQYSIYGKDKDKGNTKSVPGPEPSVDPAPEVQ